jgi:cytochrome bd-type quinol oxidase subunit 1
LEEVLFWLLSIACCGFWWTYRAHTKVSREYRRLFGWRQSFCGMWAVGWFVSEFSGRMDLPISRILPKERECESKIIH